MRMEDGWDDFLARWKGGRLWGGRRGNMEYEKNKQGEKDFFSIPLEKLLPQFIKRSNDLLSEITAIPFQNSYVYNMFCNRLLYR